MYDMIYEFLAALHGNSTAPHYDLFMDIGTYLYLGVVVLFVLWFMFFLGRVFYNLIRIIPHAFLRPARIRTRWLDETWEKAKTWKRKRKAKKASHE